MNVSHGNDWTVLVDDESVSDVGCHWTAGGYSVFEVDHDDFAALVREAVDGD